MIKDWFGFPIILSLILLLVPRFSWADGKIPVPSVVFLGDVEGNWERVQSFIDNSNIFEERDGRLELKPGYDFVFTGDASDRGDASMKILDFLNDLKERYPSRVHLQIGNRDINKLILMEGLSPSSLKEVPPEFKTWLADKGQSPDASNLHDRSLRLKWILEAKRGAPQAFEFRRQELAHQKGRSQITDDEVVRSMLDDLKPGGRITRFLENAELVTLLKGPGILSVHGAIRDESLGKLPDGTFTENLSVWADIMNSVARKAIVDAVQGVSSGAWEWLKAYQHPLPGSDSNPGSVIYGRFADSTGNPQPLSENEVRILKKNHIKTVAVGHTPVGEIPVIMRSAGGISVVIFDLSHSSRAESPVVYVHDGILNSSVHTDEFGLVKMSNAPRLENYLMGRRTRDGRWIVGRMEDGRYLTFKVQYEGAEIFKNVVKPEAPTREFIGSVDFGPDNCAGLFEQILSR